MTNNLNNIKECEYATPMNTLGMGNVQLPTDTNVGSEPLSINPKRKKKRLNNLKDYIKKHTKK